MKTCLLSLLLFALVLALVIVNASFLTTSIEEMRTSLSNIPTPPEASEDLSMQLSSLSKVEAFWYQKRFLFALTISHKDLKEIEQHFASAMGSAKSNSREDYIVSLTQLDYALSHLGAMSRFCLQNIF